MRLKIICVLKSGGDFDSDYVENLWNNVSCKINIPFDFICYSDIKTKWTKPLKLGLKGWWSKVEIFQEVGPCIYFDLDTCILRDISELADMVVNKTECFWMMNPATKRRRKRFEFTSGVMAWNGDYSFFFNEFEQPNYRTDQQYFINKADEKNAEIKAINNLLPEGSFGSFKRDVKKYGIGDGLKICYFHGNPRPRDVGFPFWTIKGDHKQMKIEDLKDMYLGETLFICASGPSLDKIDKSLISQPGIITMGLNNSPSNFRPNLWVHVDPAKKFLPSIWADPTILKFSPRVKQNSSVFYENEDEVTEIDYRAPIINFKLNTKYNKETFLSEPTVNFGFNKKDGGSRSVFMAAIKIAYMLGFRRIFLLGVDFEMKEGEQNYCFEQDRTSHAVKGNNRTYNDLNDRFSEMKEHFKDHRLTVFNCNEASKLESFQFVSIKEAIVIALADFPDPKTESTKGMYDGDNKKKKEGQVRKNRANSKWRDDITITSKKQIAVTGMSRSGTHAVTDWIASQHEGRVEFRNDIFRRSGSGYKLYDPWTNEFPDRLYKLPSMKEIVNTDEDINLVAYTYENQHGSIFKSHPLIKSDEVINTVLIRDPYNLLATLGKHVENGRGYWFAKNCSKDDGNGNKIVDCDKLYLFADMWLSHVELSRKSGMIPILYNKWKESEEYRDELAVKLNVDSRRDDSMKRVPVNGQGSSFNLLKMDGNGEQMKTLERWRHFEDEEWFREFFKNNPRLVESSNKLFGHIEGTEILFK